MLRKYTIAIIMFLCLQASAQDTCKVGIFITDIYDLNLADKSFAAQFWLWGLYKNDSIKILENMELTGAKDHEYSLSTTERRGKYNYATQKGKATFKKDWNITNFPFDRQKLAITIESGDAEHNELVYLADTKNSSYDASHIKIEGWKISKFETKAEVKSYTSNYGDPEITGKAQYSSFIATITLERDGWGLFFKLFTGLYVAFAISLLPFFMGPENAERFGVLVGALFAAVANKYVVDSILPETNDYTLVDKIHVLAFVYVLISLIMTVLAYRLFAIGKNNLAKKIDWWAFWVTFISFFSINVYLIVKVFIS
ncbi:hypothetical protein AD998_09020 [bacterium 336/3]|jgi:hypothetical protein|nr:hypothetical protein AD998_09020 [bacterium 336/3]